MLIPLEWLAEFVDCPASPEELADRLTLTGNEIEEIRDSALGPVLDLKLTPNRGDMLSIQGAAREVGAVYGLPFRCVEPRPKLTGPDEPGVTVTLEAPDLCPRYVALVIRGVRIGPSPEWLVGRLEAAGMRSISNVVDATNYVMWEMGQPLHAFDLDRLAEHRIVVRRARPGERMTVITGEEITLQPEMLVIADAAQPVALAGVMGGRDSEVTAETTSILLESAYFLPASIRRTARRCQLATQASYRFERGVNPDLVLQSALRAAELIAELAGGQVSITVRDEYPHPIPPPLIPYRPARCCALLGEQVTPEAQAEFLRLVGCDVDRTDRSDPPDHTNWTITAPLHRPDLAIEEDLIEEVGRLHGYDRLGETLPAGENPGGRLSAAERLSRRVRELLLGQGYFEAVTNTLVSRAQLDVFQLRESPAWRADGLGPVALRNPVSEDFTLLRPSLLVGLLGAAQRNRRRGRNDVFLFEIGRAQGWTSGGECAERLLVGGIACGNRWSGTWNSDPCLAADFYATKGSVEALLTALGIEGLRTVRPEDAGVSVPAFHPGRSAAILTGSTFLGAVGEVHPETAAAADLPRGVYCFELDAEAILEAVETCRRYTPPSRYPSARRDLALVAGSDTACSAIEAIIRQAFALYTVNVRLFDVYSGKPLQPGQFSLAFSIEATAADRTLTDSEVDACLMLARERLGAELNVTIRE